MHFLEPSNHFKDLIWDLWQFHSFLVNVKIFLGKLFHLNWVWVARIKLLKHEGFPRFKFNDTDRFHSDLFHKFTLRAKESLKVFLDSNLITLADFNLNCFIFYLRAKESSITFNHTDRFHFDLFHNSNLRAKRFHQVTLNHTDRFESELFHYLPWRFSLIHI